MRTYLSSHNLIYKFDIPYILGHSVLPISSSDLARTTQGGSASNQEVGMCIKMLNQILYIFK